MLGEHFYHGQIRKIVAAFGTLFNNIEVKKKDAAGKILQTIKVPLSYGPQQKFLARIQERTDLNDTKVAIKLPRMSFEITLLQYDNSIAIKKDNYIQKQNSTDPTKYDIIRGPIPYRIGFQLAIMTKNQDDALQVLEQILPFFQPDFTITINDIPDMDIKSDIPITLQSVAMNDDYEGDFETRRAIIYQLDFEARVKFYTGITDKAMILTAAADLNVDIGDDTYGFAEEVTAEGDETTLSSEVGIDTVDDNAITPWGKLWVRMI